MSLLLAFSLLLACGDKDAADSGAAADSGDPATARQPPPYSGGDCPVLTDGTQDFGSGDDTRSIKVRLPADPQGAPVLFAWHWLGGSAGDIIRYMDLGELATEQGVIVIAPESRSGEQFEWDFLSGPDGNADGLFFEDLLSCAHATWDVDLDRVHAMGMSAGGLWTTWLTMYASEWLASTAPLSGGTLPGAYESPAEQIPVLLTWGGVSDTFQTLSFDETNQYFSTELQDDGHFVMECVHDGGHTIPDGATAWVWEFLDDHPRGAASPYVDGLPAAFPDWCALP